MNKEITKEEFCAAVEIVKAYKEQCEQSIKQANDVIPIDPTLKLMDLDISVRLHNILRSNISHVLDKTNPWHIFLIDLEKVSKSDVIRSRGIGKKGLVELDEILNKYSLKMLP